MMAKSIKDRYLSTYEAFAKKLAFKEPAWLRLLRQSAVTNFSELKFPSGNDEEWKHTNVSSVTELFFTPSYSKTGLITKDVISQLVFSDEKCPRLVFINGYYCQALSSVPNLASGISVKSLREAIYSDPEILEKHLTKYVVNEKNIFTALNSAFLSDGALVRIPKEVVLSAPIQLLFLSSSSDKNILVQPRILVLLEEGAQATVIEQYVSLKNRSYFTNAVIEISVGANAALDYYRITEEGSCASHISTVAVMQEHSSKFASYHLTFGAKLVRNDIAVKFNAENAVTLLNGLYIAKDTEQVDNHLIIDHAKPNCTSRELYKGILDGRSRAVFSGKIFVQPDAQGTDANLFNKNLLLSDNAKVNTKPQLKIFADDVKCVHGAAVGQLDEAMIFYLRSRGLSKEIASRLLLQGFANEVLNCFPIGSVRAGIEKLAFQRLNPH